MKKILHTLTIILVLTGWSQAQHNPQQLSQAEKRTGAPQMKSFDSRDTGDTLFHFDGYYYFVNDFDFPDFEMKFFDLDSLEPHTNNYYEDSKWQFYYWEIAPGDTLSWVEATSWFDPAGQANDWITFGPLTIPSGGATLSWKDYFNPQFRNGYEVIINTEGMDSADFTNEPVYTLEDLYQQSSEDIDTNRRFQNPPQQVELPSEYNDTSVYIAIHHNSENMDVLHLTDFVMTRKGVGVEDFTRQSIQNVKSYPNPTKEKVNISFFSDEAANVSLKLYDLAGAVVKTREIEIQGGERHTFTLNVSGLTPGMYFYELNNGKGKVTRKLIVE
ncbi:MAG: T9SS type A sorting domain-containing protein [Bacteroidales bacterium]|nr:T9SS type A sorting domain-containing protein [Bacteroidales bacterium]MCF8333321.1 T9SS type A sorting domain-containing protein [Bacteroidales bacterium]